MRSTEQRANGHSAWVAEGAPLRVVAAILRQDDRVLLCHRHPNREWYPNVWDLPGGHIEPSEEAADALVRELREELGIEVTRGLALPFQQVTDAAAGVQLMIWLLDWDGAVVNDAPEEHDELRWMTSDELRHVPLAHPSYVQLLSDALIA